MTLRTLNYGNYGIFLIMGNAGFCPSTVVVDPGPQLGSWVPGVWPEGDRAGRETSCRGGATLHCDPGTTPR